MPDSIHRVPKNNYSNLSHISTPGHHGLFNLLLLLLLLNTCKLFSDDKNLLLCRQRTMLLLLDTCNFFYRQNCFQTLFFVFLSRAPALRAWLTWKNVILEILFINCIRRLHEGYPYVNVGFTKIKGKKCWLQFCRCQLESFTTDLGELWSRLDNHWQGESLRLYI